MELVAGMIVAERFRLVSELGRGGMGSVWAATHVVTKKQVALKFMLANSTEMTARFVREAQTASAVRHPNVVEIHDILPLPDGTPLMVMEMLAGESLAAKLARERRLSPIETAQIMGPVISAVAAAHAAGIVHRDLKPENIFLARYSGMNILPKVLDFGIAKLVAHNVGGQHESALTRTGSVLGTPYYMSPEQVFGEKDVDVRADIWSLGVILYECLCGQRPFEGENFGQLLKAVTSGRFAPIGDLAPWVAPQVADVIISMLRDRPTRLSDLTEVERALSAVRCAPSGPGLPIPPASQSASAYTMTPSSGAFALSGFPAGSGGYPVVQHASGGHAIAPPAQASGGDPVAHGPGAYPAAAPSAMTPSPMVRSQAMAPAPSLRPIPMHSAIGGRIAAAVVGIFLLGGGGVWLVRARIGGAHSAASGSAAAPMTSAPETLEALATLTPPRTDPPRDEVADAGVAAAAHSTAATAPIRPTASAASADASASTPGANSNHAGATGGLSTAVPF